MFLMMVLTMRKMRIKQPMSDFVVDIGLNGQTHRFLVKSAEDGFGAVQEAMRTCREARLAVGNVFSVRPARLVDDYRELTQDLANQIAKEGG